MFFLRSDFVLPGHVATTDFFQRPQHRLQTDREFIPIWLETKLVATRSAQSCGNGFEHSSGLLKLREIHSWPHCSHRPWDCLAVTMTTRSLSIVIRVRRLAVTLRLRGVNRRVGDTLPEADDVRQRICLGTTSGQLRYCKHED